MKRTMVHHRNAIYLSVLILLSVVLWLPRLRGPLDLRYDAGVYYILGTSLAQGKGYRLLNEPGEIQAIQYPPLLPLLAAAHQRLVGSGDPAIAGHWLRLFFFVLFLAFTAAVYRLTRYYMVPGLAFLTTLIVFLHVHTTWMSELFFAELPFALTSVLFLLVTQQQGEGAREWLAGSLGAMCFLLRSAGVALLAAWIGESLLRRRFGGTVLRTTLALIPVIAWQGYIAHVKRSPEYTQLGYEYQRAGYQFYNVGYSENLTYVDSFTPELGMVSPQLLVQRIARNLVHIPASFGGVVSVDPERVRSKLERINEGLKTLRAPVWLAEIPFVILGALVLLGLVLLYLRGERLIVLYVVASAGIICLTPWPGQFIRYLWPMAPVLALALFMPLITLRDRLSAVTHKGWRLLAIALITTIIIGAFSVEWFALAKTYQLSAKAFYKTPSGQRREYRLFYYTPAWQLHDAAIDRLEGEADPNAIVVTSTPHWVYLKAGLRAIMPPFDPDVEAAQQLIDSVPVNYLIIDSLEFADITRRYVAPVVEAFPECWEQIYSSANGRSRIYRRVNPGGNVPPVPARAREGRSSSS